MNLQHPTESYSHSRFTSMGLHRNWMRECLWKTGKESLMIADMDTQDLSEQRFADVVCEVYTQLCMRHH